MDTTQSIIDAIRDHLGDGRVVVIVVQTTAEAKPVEPAPTDPEYLTVKRAAAHFSISERTIYRMIEDGLPVTRVGRTGRGVRVRPPDLAKALAKLGTLLH